jgi:hypothetical protein
MLHSVQHDIDHLLHTTAERRSFPPTGVALVAEGDDREGPRRLPAGHGSLMHPCFLPA